MTFQTDMANIINNLNTEIGRIEGATMAGLLTGAHIIERESNEHVPREYGNLIGSSYARKAMDYQQAAEIGYGAKYALWVHENLAMKLWGRPRPSGLGHYWGPHGMPKFLQRAVFKKAADVVQAVFNRAKVR